MKALFSFFKAGQGLFYGGRIWDQETKRVYTVVYDCGTYPFITGSTQSLNNEINFFKYWQPYSLPINDEIELLFISHLDYDHVSGLKRLLQEFKVKNIILPYIDKEHRKVFLASIPDYDDSVNSLSFEDYFSFIESPNQFISRQSQSTNMFFVKPNDNNNTEYQGYTDNDNQSDAYARGTINHDKDELTGQTNATKYENNLQFFIKKHWEFTTYCKNVSQDAINKLRDSLKRTFGKETSEDLSLDNLKQIVTDKRKEAHKCYTDCIGEINSYGLVLLHGPINLKDLSGIFYSDCDLNCCYNDYSWRPHFYDEDCLKKNKRFMLGTILFGDTSINKENNPVDFPQAFKNKLANVHVVQVPHHGSSNNWDFDAFEALNIGENINCWRHHVLSVCNFGVGNTYGHPSYQVLRDLSSAIFLNTQFSRLNIWYEWSC